MSLSSTAPEALKTWLGSLSQLSHPLNLDTIEKASSDAGFREYWRVRDTTSTSFIVMDASRETPESFTQFVAIDQMMRDAGLRVPMLLAQNAQDRYLLLNDLGEKTALQVVNEENAFTLMNEATDALVLWQKASREGVLPNYDREVLVRELNLFPEWYVNVHRQVTWTPTQQKWWQMTVDALLDNIERQAKVYVHRDFMLRNFMPSPEGLGILDFQDALYGPVTYDIASLTRDAFISWNESFVLDVCIRYWEKARKAGIPVPSDIATFYQDVEFMSVQRHLKVLGIFARLNYRDHKPKYLADTPRFIGYLRATTKRYTALSPLMHLIDELEGSDKKVGYTF